MAPGLCGGGGGGGVDGGGPGDGRGSDDFLRLLPSSPLVHPSSPLVHSPAWPALTWFLDQQHAVADIHNAAPTVGPPLRLVLVSGSLQSTAGLPVQEPIALRTTNSASSLRSGNGSPPLALAPSALGRLRPSSKSSVSSPLYPSSRITPVPSSSPDFGSGRISTSSLLYSPPRDRLLRPSSRASVSISSPTKHAPSSFYDYARLSARSSSRHLWPEQQSHPFRPLLSHPESPVSAQRSLTPHGSGVSSLPSSPPPGLTSAVEAAERWVQEDNGYHYIVERDGLEAARRPEWLRASIRRLQGCHEAELGRWPRTTSCAERRCRLSATTSIDRCFA